MNIENAIKYLEESMIDENMVELVCEAEHNEALEAIIKAAKLQIPEKPELTITREDIKVGSRVLKKGVKLYKCGKCKEFILRCSYCPKCGQRLDWD